MTVSELIPSVFGPVLLGCDRKARRLGRRLFWRHGMLSHAFAKRFSPLCRLSPWMICHPLPSGASSALYEMALCDFAKEQKELDRTPLLFWAEDKHQNLFSDQQKKALESFFVLCPDETEKALTRLIAYQGGNSL